MVSHSQRFMEICEFCPFTDSYLKDSKTVVKKVISVAKIDFIFCIQKSPQQNFLWKLHCITFVIPKLFLVSPRFNSSVALCWCALIDQLFLLLQRSIALFPRSRCLTDVRMTCPQATTWFPSTSLQPLKTNQRCSAVRIYKLSILS